MVMLKIQVLFVIIVRFLVRDSICGQSYGELISDVIRLPDTTRPKSYDVSFVPNFKGPNSTYSGVAKIVVSASLATDAITLNIGKELNVTDVTVTRIGDGDEPIGVTEYREINEQFNIQLDQLLVTNRSYAVTIRYTGRFRNDRTGFYLSSYDEDNDTKWMAVTHFEPNYARRAFPCYDEPAYKATFDISIVKLQNQIALSNMPIRSVELGPDNTTEWVHFESTPPMPTYLAAIFVGEFVPKKFGSNITVYTHKDYVNQTEYVGAVVSNNIRVLEEYTGIDYRLPKMDMLAIPDTRAKAMENWGMTTFRENNLLIDEQSKSKTKMETLMIVQHEFAHQWFGNLVTCSWWDYAWLNEGFSTYFEYFATKIVNPSWPMEELFVVKTHQTSFQFDQSLYENPVTKTKPMIDVGLIFDEITYLKAASVLRMLRCLVTERLFQLSIKDYLNVNQENSVQPSDLYTSFDRVLLQNNYKLGNGLTVEQFMSNWTLQTGHPFLSITKNETSFSVTQNRCFMYTYIVNHYASSAWHIGLTYTTELDKNFSNIKPLAWTSKTSKLTVLPAPRNSGWYIFNIQSTGYYRVNYDNDNWMALIKQLIDDPTTIHVLNRAQLLDDAFNLAKAGYLNYSVFLNLTKYLEKENSTIPWYPAKAGLSYILIRVRELRKQGFENFEAHVIHLAGIMFKKLDDAVCAGNDDLQVAIAWEEFGKWACNLGNKYCKMKALEYFKRLQKGEQIPADIKKVALCEGVKHNIYSSSFDLMSIQMKSIFQKMPYVYARRCDDNAHWFIADMWIFNIRADEIRQWSLENKIMEVELTPATTDKPLTMNNSSYTTTDFLESSSTSSTISTTTPTSTSERAIEQNGL